MSLQAEVEVNGVRYCMGHAMTTDPMAPSISFEEHLMGNMEMGSFFEKGVEGYVSGDRGALLLPQIILHRHHLHMEWAKPG